MIAEEENKRSQNVQSEQPMDIQQKKQLIDYKLEFTGDEAQFVEKFLPKGYSLQIQSKIQKRPSTSGAIKAPRASQVKKKSVDSKLLNQNERFEQELSRPLPMRAKKSINMKYNDQINEVVYTKYAPTYPPPQLNRRNTYQGLDDSLKPCVKILNLLKNSKTSWPFRQPVDAIAMGIPHYLEIIKEPMDLSKIQSNLRTGQYATPTQFHADINKIIRNCYTFNQGNIEFGKITQQFQEYYFKIIASPNPDQKPPAQSSFQNPKSLKAPSILPSRKSLPTKRPSGPFSTSNPISLAQKKQLSINIRRLQRQHMKGIVDIVKQEGDSKIKDQFDLEDLKPETIRQLQAYVRTKLVEPAHRMGEHKPLDRQGNHESDFEIESEDDS